MKTNFPTKTNLAIACLFFTLMLSLQGCDDADNLFQEEPVTNDQMIVDNISSFLNDVEATRQNPVLKSRKAIGIDSAVWYMEAAINFTSTEVISNKNALMKQIKFRQSVESQNGNISMHAIQKAYDAFKDSLASIQDANEIFIADVYVDGDNGTNVNLVLSLGVSTGKILIQPTQYDWYWGCGLGRCDGSGLGVGQDAASIINSYLNQAIIVPPAGAFWTDVETTILEGQADGLFEFLIDAGLYQGPPCLSSAEINQYIDVVQAATANAQPANKQLSNRYFGYDIVTSIDYYGGRHYCHISFAKMVYGITPK